MQSRWYWKQWRSEYRTIWYGVAFLFVASMLLFCYNYFMGTDAVIHWQKFHDQKMMETISHTFQVGNFELSVPIESYLTFEYFNGSELQPNTFVAHAFVFFLVFASIILLAVITTFERYWYLIGTGLFILFIASLRLDVLRLFGFTGQWTTIGVLTVYVLISFYFNSFNSAANFIVRLITFLTITIVFGGLIYFFASVPYPFLHLSVSGYVAGMVITVLFMIMIAHEIIASFIYLTSQSSTSSKSLRHFLIISSIYLLNLLFTFMRGAGIINWNILIVSPFLLLTISIVLSLWGYRQREKLFQNITSFNPFGAYFLVSLAIIAFSTIAMLMGSANDPATKVIHDLIIFTHLGYGLAFLMYVLSNFIVMLAENLNVYKVLYTPTRMPYFTYRLAGLIISLAFLFYSDWKVYVYNSASGFYNSMGDLYQVMEKRPIAEAYYQQGRVYGYANHHSNYVIGYMEGLKNDLEQSRYHYDLINEKRSTEFSQINKGNLYLFEERYFNAIYSLKESLKTFPRSGPIKNNLGYTYSKIHLMDSALLMLEAARESKISKETAEINFLAFLGQEYFPVRADSIAAVFGTQSKGVVSNALAVASLQNQSFDTKLNPTDTKILDLASATLLNNYIVNKLKSVDTALVKEAHRIASDSVNSGFSEALKATLSQAYYHQNNVSKSFQLLAELAYVSQTLQGKYNYIMGLWALEQGNPLLAAQCFAYAVQFSYKEANLYSAIALAEAQHPDALVAADTLMNSNKLEEQEIGRQLRKALTISLPEVLKQTDLDKYQFIRYRVKASDSVSFNKIVNTFTDSNYKAQTLLEMSQRQFTAGNTVGAIRYFTRLEGLQFSDKSLLEKIQHFELELLASRGQVRLLADRINAGVTFNRSQELEKLLYTALINEVSGDTLSATRNYHVLATYNPFYEEGIIASARYFKKHSPDPMRAYNILTDAVHVNQNSIRLLTAYVAEAARMGFDEYAADANQDLEALISNQ